MPRGTWNLEWLNHNSQRAYPLAEDATKVDVTTDFTLPDDFIVGLYIPVQGTMNVDPSLFFLRSLAIFSTGYNLSIAYHNPAAAPTIVAWNFARPTAARRAAGTPLLVAESRARSAAPCSG